MKELLKKLRKGFDAARLGGGFWDVVFDYDTVDDYLNR